MADFLNVTLKTVRISNVFLCISHDNMYEINT